MGRYDCGSELAYAVHSVSDEGIVLTIVGSRVRTERILCVAFQQCLLVEGNGPVLVGFRRDRVGYGT
jgi:hypothetical protein